MVDAVCNIVDILSALPEYFGKGLLELSVLVVGGVVVGWITSTYFAQKAAESEVKGDIMKKKFDIYDALVCKLDGMQQQVLLPDQITDWAVKHIKKHNIPLTFVPQYPVLSMFQTGDNLTDTVLDIDRYISANRIYFEKELHESLQVFQNYVVVFNRLMVMYREQFVNAGIDSELKEVKRFENLTAIEIGLVLQDELSDEIDAIYDKIRNSINNIKFDVHYSPDHSAKHFGQDSPIMQKLKDMKIMTECQNITKMITDNVAMGMAAVMKNSKANGRNK